MYDLQQAADLIGMSRSWLRKEVTAERVECTRFGRQIRFTDEQVEQIIAAHRQPIVEHRTRLSIVGAKPPPPPPPPPPRRPSTPPVQPRQPGKPIQPTKSVAS